MWRQSWLDLLFAHWPVEVEALQPLVPPGLEIQTFEGTAYVGVVPFRMAGVMHRPLPDLPWISAFPELNVRLYVERDGRPGVFFLSLDATNPLAVWAARRFFHLPYYRADITLDYREGPHGPFIDYRSHRRPGSADSPLFTADYGPTSEVYEAEPGTLEHWLTERYCLYAVDPKGRMTRTEVHHIPWPLQRAEATIHKNTMGDPHSVGFEGPPALLHFAQRIDVVVWSPERLG